VGRDITRDGAMVVVPSVKYHLPRLDEAFRDDEYRYTTQSLASDWGTAPLPLEKDFSPTLAGDPLADDREQILRWLREVPGRIRAAAPVRLAMKLMNARFGDDFQVAMIEAAGGADALVTFNRLFDPAAGVAYGGWDLSDRNLRVLDRVEAVRPKLTGTGNVCSGKAILDYALRGCESVQLHTLFQLPLSEFRAGDGTRTQRVLHQLVFDPADGLIAGLLALEEEGKLARRGGELHFLDVADAHRSR
jgi:hypothetical protein